MKVLVCKRLLQLGQDRLFLFLFLGSLGKKGGRKSRTKPRWAQTEGAAAHLFIEWLILKVFIFCFDFIPRCVAKIDKATNKRQDAAQKRCHSTTGTTAPPSILCARKAKEGNQEEPGTVFVPFDIGA